MVTRLRNFIADKVREKSVSDYSTVQYHKIIDLIDNQRPVGTMQRMAGLNEEQFGRLVQDLGETNFTPDELTKLFKSYDLDADNKVSVMELLRGLHVPDPARNQPSHPGNSDPPPGRRAGWGKDPIAAEEVIPEVDHKGRINVDLVSVDDILRGLQDKMFFKEPVDRKAKHLFTHHMAFFDKDQSGRIDEKSLRKGLWQLGFGLPESQLQLLFASLGGSGPVGQRSFDYKLLADRMMAVGPDLRRFPKSPEAAEPTGRMCSIYDKQPAPPVPGLAELVAKSTNTRLFTHGRSGLRLDLSTVLNPTTAAATSTTSACGLSPWVP
jgi:Ca2+-binding EF-hand superfamily protein